MSPPLTEFKPREGRGLTRCPSLQGYRSKCPEREDGQERTSSLGGGGLKLGEMGALGSTPWLGGRSSELGVQTTAVLLTSFGDLVTSLSSAPQVSHFKSGNRDSTDLAEML